MMDRISRQKISNEMEELNSIVKQLDLTNIYWVFHPTTEHKVFSSKHGILSRGNHIIGHKKSLLCCKLHNQSENPTERFTKHMYNKKLVCTIYKELLQIMKSLQKRQMIQFLNGLRIWIVIFSKQIYKWKDVQYN
jgi:hypothetical protein